MLSVVNPLRAAKIAFADYFHFHDLAVGKLLADNYRTEKDSLIANSLVAPALIALR